MLAAARRGLSTPKSRLAVVLRLSSLPPPLPRAHHRRIARAIFEEVAQHHHGEMFELGCGDIVLLCRTPSQDAASDPALHPTALPHVLSRLFRIDVPDGAVLSTLWMLERDGTDLLGYAVQQASRSEACRPR